MANNSINFTKESLEALLSAKSGFDTYKDRQEKGLILAVTANSVKTFYLLKKISGKAYRLKIGRFPDLNVKEARAKAIEYKNQIAKGCNPAEEKRALSSEVTFKELFDRYINDYAKHNNKCWRDEVTAVELKARHLYSKKLSTISNDDMQRLFRKITEQSGRIAANRFIDRLRAIFNKAIEWGWKGTNPVLGIKKHKEKSRDRYLLREEMPKFFEALSEEENTKIGDYILLSLLTGARKSNVLSMRWQDVSFKDESLYLPDTKNGEPQLLPLVPEALAILERRSKCKDRSQWVFPSKTSATGHLQEPKKVWRRVLLRATIKIWLADSNLNSLIKDAKKSLPSGYNEHLLFITITEKAKKQGVELPAGVMDVRLHDLRRSLGSWLCHSGASAYIIGKSLNHKSNKSTEVYARLSIDPVREAMHKAAEMMRMK